MVLEASGSNEAHDREKLEGLLGFLADAGHVLDGALAADAAQARELWGIRERITEALVRRGAVYKYDVSLPTARMYEMARRRHTRVYLCCCVHPAFAEAAARGAARRWTTCARGCGGARGRTARRRWWSATGTSATGTCT